MAEKKATKAAATKAAPKAEATKKAATKKVAAKKETLVINAETVGFKAGDVYQTLAAAEKALISNDEALLGLGWLLKEGKVQANDNKIALA